MSLKNKPATSKVRAMKNIFSSDNSPEFQIQAICWQTAFGNKIGMWDSLQTEPLFQEPQSTPPSIIKETSQHPQTPARKLLSLKMASWLYWADRSLLGSHGHSVLLSPYFPAQSCHPELEATVAASPGRIPGKRADSFPNAGAALGASWQTL